MHNKLLIASIGLLVGVVLAVGALALRPRISPLLSPSPEPTILPSSIPSLPSTSEPTVEPSSTPVQTSIYYPMTRYEERITNRGHGKTITAADSEPLACGYPFTGFHVGDDLEVFPDELDAAVPVYAVADGTVRQVGNVNGYGGLIVIEHRLNDQVVTAYYGHVALGGVNLSADSQVKAGQRLAYLGANCSSQTSNERKHLHFAIRRGNSVNVRGYVPNENDLANWYNPRDLLKQLGANQPGE